MATGTHTDAMIVRLSKDVAEAEAVIENNVRMAQDAERDLNDYELNTNVEARKRIEVATTQLDELYASSSRIISARKKADELGTEMARLRAQVDGQAQVEYRSAGNWIFDHWKAHNGDRSARERLEVYNRTADHQLTDDTPGVIPDPIVGPIINRIDTNRPIISFIGAERLPAWSFHRPRVTQQTQVGLQTDGGTAPVTQKVELESRKMLIERVPVEASTYGGYVNIALQSRDYSSPNIVDLVVASLAGQYAIETEEVAADVLAAVNTSAVDYPLNPTADELTASIWEAVAAADSAVPEQGSNVLFVAPDRLRVVGPMFAPYGPMNQQGTGFLASQFGSGVKGTISGIPVVMSKQLDSGEMFLVNTAAIEFYEQIGGQLQVTEPSVLGIQVAYYGYFATLVATAGGVVPLEEASA